MEQSEPALDGRDPRIRPGSSSPDAAVAEVVVARQREAIAELLPGIRALDPLAGVSARVPGADLLVTSPDPRLGAPGPAAMIVADLDGRPVDDSPGSTGSPAAHVALHAALYRSLPIVGGAVHLPSADRAAAAVVLGADARDAADRARASASPDSPTHP